MNRRNFLRYMGAAAGAAAVTGLVRRRADAAPFGTFPADAGAVQLPEGKRARRVLEIFLYGGISQWETLYFVPEYGRAGSMHPGTQYYAFESQNAEALSACGFVGNELGHAFGRDANGATVHLGPFAQQLWNRPDVLERMRLIVQRHELAPHEAAVPLALTGRPVGQPTGAGLGSHVQRHFLDNDRGSNRAAPYSYVFATGGISSDNVSAAADTGMHPGAARPLLIKVDNAQLLGDLLARGTVGERRAAHDALTQIYVDQYENRLRWKGGDRVRSARLDDLAVAAETAGRADAIATVLDRDLFKARPGQACGRDVETNIPLMSLEAARHLLTLPGEAARYVCVSDVGLYEASGGGGYDTHSLNATDTATNFDNLLRCLLGIINGPGERDPRKLDLDDTLIILNTEFGRTPEPQEEGSDGRNHHPYGYTTAFIGGPIRKGQAGVFGAIGEDGKATHWVSPSENRIAALLAMGIWPFAPEAFAVSDVIQAGSERDAATRALDHYLGIKL